MMAVLSDANKLKSMSFWWCVYPENMKMLALNQCFEFRALMKATNVLYLHLNTLQLILFNIRCIIQEQSMYFINYTVITIGSRDIKLQKPIT